MSDEEVKRELLAQIRARRDEMENSSYFWSLFDDGAEFGPPKPEPEWQFMPGEDGFVFVAKDGIAIDNMRTDTFNAIKRLGAEEARRTALEAAESELFGPTVVKTARQIEEARGE